jgi:hypothetical protein
MALWVALTMFQHLINGFHNRDLRQHVANLLGVDLNSYSANQMTYDLRRLLRKGIVFRAEGTNRYFLTPYGWKMARLFARLESRVFRPATAAASPACRGQQPRRAIRLAHRKRCTAQKGQLKLDTFIQIISE